MVPSPAELFAQLKAQAPASGVAALAEQSAAPTAHLPPEALFAALLRCASDSIYFKDSEGRYVAVSEHLARRSGAAGASAMVGRTDFDFFDRDHAASAFASEQNIQRTGEPMTDLEEKQVWPDGSITWISTSRFPLRTPAGDLVGTFGISRDITVRKAAEEQLAQTQRELIEAARQTAVAEYATAVVSQLTSLTDALARLIAATRSHASTGTLQELQHALQSAPAVTPEAAPLAARLQQERAQVAEDLEELQQHAEQLQRVLQMSG